VFVTNKIGSNCDKGAFLNLKKILPVQNWLPWPREGRKTAAASGSSLLLTDCGAQP